MPTKKTSANGNGGAKPGPRYVDMTQLFDTGAHAMSDEDRDKVLQELSKPVSSAKPGELGEQAHMTLWEEFLAVVFLFFFIGSMLWLPMAILLFIIFVRSPVAWVVMAVTLVVLGTHPIRRNHEFVQSPLNRLLFKYFSLKMCWDEEIDPKGQYIFVAPPHGVMPMGNLLTVHAMRNLNGLDFRGLTTDAALNLPLFRHYLKLIGTINASSSSCTKYIKKGWSLGISSGGVAEIFCANDPDEVIIMKDRKGFVKLALRNGLSIVPCYIFGNTKLLSAWYDESGFLETLSRKLKFGMLPLWGRFGLPIMFRHPIVGVTAKPIALPKVEGEPTQEMIDKYHQIFCDELQALFEKYKGLYGWPDKKLIIR